MFNNYYIRIDFSKNTKLAYYFKNILQMCIPSIFYRKQLDEILKKTDINNKLLDARVNYYNKLKNDFTLENMIPTIKAYKKEKKRTYFFDLFAYLRYFPSHFKIAYLFGDVVTIPSVPTIVKSRPIDGDNCNSILMKLNKVRHFIFIDDKIDFKDKKDILVWRGKAHMPHRQVFVKKFYKSKYCDIGQTSKNHDATIPWHKYKMRISKQLEYKFIFSIEGNDVASNLKWAMSSNSLVLMRKPRYETWFMEGLLIADYHYVLLDDDYTNLEQKIKYYIEHTEEALMLIDNANDYVKQFKDKALEDKISLMVLDKYFNKSSQRIEKSL